LLAGLCCALLFVAAGCGAGTGTGDTDGRSGAAAGPGGSGAVGSAGSGSGSSGGSSGGSGGESPGRSSGGSSKPVQIEFWYALGGDIGEVIEQQVEQFNRSQDKYVVQAVFQNSYDLLGQKLHAAVVGGDVPAIVQLNSREWYDFVKVLEPLDEYIANDPSFDFGDFNPGLLVNTAYDGKQYTIPYNRSTPILYYNKDIMREIGVDPEDPVPTWDALVEVARKATIHADGGVDRFGFSASMSGWYFYSMIWSNGGDILNEDYTRAVFDRPEAAYGLQLWSDMINVEQTMAPPVGGASTSGSAAGVSSRQNFFNGNIAMIIESTGSLGQYEKNSPFDLGTAFMPKFKEYAVPTGGGNLAVMAAASEEEKAGAWEFIRFVTSTEQSADFVMKTGFLPVRLSAEGLDALQQYYAEHPNYTVALRQLAYARELPPVTELKRIETELNKAMERAVVERIPAEEALREAAETINEVLAKK
jgi:sn-glycerol 3-phosphate transport system substrate-binding protein